MKETGWQRQYWMERAYAPLQKSRIRVKIEMLICLKKEKQEEYEDYGS